MHFNSNAIVFRTENVNSPEDNSVAVETHCDLIEPSTLTPQIGTSYVVIIKQEEVQPTECYMQDPDDNKYQIDLDHSGIKPTAVNKYISGLELGGSNDVVTSLGNGICGFKMDNVSWNTTDTWVLSFLGADDQTYEDTASIIPLKSKSTYKQSYLSVGDYLLLSCEDTELKACRFYNPNNELIVSGTRSCTVRVNVTKLADFGTWKCVLYYDFNMIKTENIFEVTKLEQDQVTTWQNETDTHYNLGCSVNNLKDVFDYCLMVRPDGTEFKLDRNQATERYTALFTNETANICFLQILKPLIKEEKGLWRCEHYEYVRTEPIGGLITVPGAKEKEAEIPKTIIVYENNTLTAKCRAPYSSTYCYMKGPDGTIYPVKDDHSVTLGLCVFSKPNIQLVDNGTWFCGFAQQTGEPDKLYQFEVFVPEFPYVKPEVDSVESSVGDSVRLKCSTKGLGDYPLKYCRFRSPNGDIYQIGNHKKSDRLSYDGQGLEHGDCGIQIHKLQQSDIGTWSCITRIGSNFDQDELYVNMHVSSKNNLSIASIFGIAFGAIIVVLAISVFAFRAWKRRRNVSNPFQVFFSSNTSPEDSVGITANSSPEGSVVFPISVDTDNNLNDTTIHN